MSRSVRRSRRRSRAGHSTRARTAASAVCPIILIMANQSVLVTGSCGLIGSEVSVFFARQGFQVAGIDSNHRAVFFGPEGDTSWVLERLRREIPGYRRDLAVVSENKADELS